MSIPVQLHYTEQGSGTPLILLHGFPLSSIIWREQVNRLSDQARVITPDLRGHGRSPSSDDIYEMELLARDVVELMDTLEIPQAVVMGHSMGGYVALALARIARNRLKALGLIASQSAADSEEARQNRYKLAERVVNEGSIAVAESMLPRLFAPGEHEDDTMVETVNTVMLNTRPQTLINSLKGMAVRTDSTPLLGTFDFPVLIVTGDQDAIIPLQKAEQMAAALKNGTLVTIENAGHMTMMEQPQATSLAIRNFITELSG
ncbi:MAG: alpha/beta hydrolase [Anaerolineae bacterium]|nr:alpha/beta hydrolase [Anaerolineae bacterium]